MIRALVKEFVKQTEHMQNGDYARIAMIEALTQMTLKYDCKDFFFELRQEVIDYVE